MEECKLEGKEKGRVFGDRGWSEGRQEGGVCVIDVQRWLR